MLGLSHEPNRETLASARLAPWTLGRSADEDPGDRCGRTEPANPLNGLRSDWSRVSAVLSLLLCACTGSRASTATVAPAADVVAVVYLIGDAGFPAPGGEPVLEALKQDILETAGPEQRVVFLGDNIYPSGMPPVGEGRDDRTKRAEAERRSLAQVEVGLATTTPMVFVPGNHDWDPYNGTGRDAVLQQEAFVESAGGELVAWLPDGGCPGPDVHDLNDSIRLVVLDTEWWLRSEGKPAHPTSDCPADSESEIVEQLGRRLAKGRAASRHCRRPPPARNGWPSRGFISRSASISFRFGTGTVGSGCRFLSWAPCTQLPENSELGSRTCPVAETEP